jgi:hypothetical protein
MTNVATKRSNLFTRMAAKWLRLHRADVVSAIWKEVDKKIPAIRPKTKSELPEELRNLK